METLEAKIQQPGEVESTGGLDARRLTQSRQQPTAGATFAIGPQAQRLIDAQTPKGVAIRK